VDVPRQFSPASHDRVRTEIRAEQEDSLSVGTPSIHLGLLSATVTITSRISNLDQNSIHLSGALRICRSPTSTLHSAVRRQVPAIYSEHHYSNWKANHFILRRSNGGFSRIARDHTLSTDVLIGAGGNPASPRAALPTNATARSVLMSSVLTKTIEYGHDM
jgi:hypothetical protein